MIPDLTIDTTSTIPEGIFDLTRFLEVGVKYDHITLKRIFWKVADLGLDAQQGDENFRIGRAFMDAVYEWWEAGCVEMSEARDRDGRPCDFWTAVWSSKHPENHEFREVEGYLMILGVPWAE